MPHRYRLKSLTRVPSLALGIALAMSGTTIAQESEPAASADTTAVEFTDILEEVVVLEELVVIGTRAQPRSVTESAVPIDVVAGEEVAKQADTDLQNLIRNIVPSYNVSTQPISDASTVVRPVNLRGLAPDHAMVLINGKRRHRAAVIHWLGNGVADGAQGPDISAIPSIALKRVEVLRDGASAQYGSDAIAGVLNFELKDSYRGGSVEIKPGIFQQGDGRTYAVAGNIGLGNPNAWVNLSAEYGNADDTDRSVQRADAAGLISAGNNAVADPAQIWGQPFVRNDLKVFANYGLTINDNIEFYGHGNYASKEVEGGFFYRNPNTRGGVYRGPVLMWDGENYHTQAEAAELGIVDGVNGTLTATLLVGNMSGGDVPVVPIVCRVPDQAALAQVMSDNNLWTFREIFSGGFTPRFGGNTTDYAVLGGLKGTTASLLSWDFSASLGRHEADFFIFNTVNASLGANSPTEFDPGAYIQTETNFNFDVTYPFSDQVFFAAGAEYRIENFEVVQGQRESFEIGPLADQGFSAASNGFPGFGTIAAGDWSRGNFAVYGDAEVTPMDNWLLALALRFENFADFGSTVNYKVATNVGLNENTKLRGSFSTGFRAPTPGQQNTFNVSTEFDPVLNDLVNNGTIPSTSRVAELRGGEQLKPEKSINFTGGVVMTIPIYPVETNIPPVNATLDYFNIAVKDRLAITPLFSLNESEVNQLINEGITSARNLQNFRFFVNDFETRTQGIDFVITTPFCCDGEISVAYNRTSTKVTKAPGFADDNEANKAAWAERKKEMEEGLPRHRANLTVTMPVKEMFEVLGRVRYYSSWYDSEDDYTYGGEFLLDLEASYAFANHSRLTVGAQNILDTYPDINPNATSLGRLYSQFSPFGFGGAFWYGKYTFSF